MTEQECMAVRNCALQYALQTAEPGEAAESVIARANAYLAYVRTPLHEPVLDAVLQRQAATVN